MKKGVILSKRYKTLLNNYGINTPLRLAHFLHNWNMKVICYQ